MTNIPCTHNHIEAAELEQISKSFPAEKEVLALAEFFKAFSDPSRLRIIQALSKSELCVCCLAETVKMSQSAVSHQLRYLKNIDIVSSKRDGKSIIYSLKDSHILHIYGEGLIHIREDNDNE